MVSFPFDSKITGYDSDNYPIYDRAVDSSTLSTMINEFVSTGVFPKEQDGFTVTAGDGMTVNVSPGSAIIKGTTCIEKDARTLTIQAADSTYDRIDSVILRYDNNENVRAIDLYVLKGTAASAPVQPTLTRDGTIFEIALANIYIPVNATTISDERITDTRGDITRCGWATGVSQDFMQSINNRFALVNSSLASINESITSLSNMPTVKTSKHIFRNSNLKLERFTAMSANGESSWGIYMGSDTFNYITEFGASSAEEVRDKTISLSIEDLRASGGVANHLLKARFCKFYKEPNYPNGLYMYIVIFAYGDENIYLQDYTLTRHYI